MQLTNFTSELTVAHANLVHGYIYFLDCKKSKSLDYDLGRLGGSHSLVGLIDIPSTTGHVVKNKIIRASISCVKKLFESVQRNIY